jgi:DUF971 family protein
MPQPKSIVLSNDPKGVTITWDDGHASTYAFLYLRKACPCALCKGERTPFDQMRGIGGRAASQQGRSADSSESSGLAGDERNVAKDMFKVGRYALGFLWGDGHNSGIYTWDYLRKMCPCAECLQ